ncbi:DUF2931 family protein [Flavobacterium johnsoniae]|uniref:DUF2931 family protein n=1 Tax=Flavobacterium johnsoniae TaxID=986 RepID=A0A1M5FUE7_FLAJO|nr:DUF2931 family protein [Flavobacterium johnsoniae]SHF95014.1 Protein of unknown function [Flavobacterium johnsoniae]
MNKITRILIFFIIILNTSCNINNYEWQSSTCQPLREYKGNENIYCVEFVRGDILTLEGETAHLPFGGSSGSWGDSRKVWTPQHGTPIGADVIYYAGYEDKFYHLKTDFPLEEMKKAMDTVYKYNDYRNYRFSGLIFGFAPQGMVVVWKEYGVFRIELGRFQAQVIKNDSELEEQLFRNWSMNRLGVKTRDYLPDASCAKWDMYRRRYTFRIKMENENPALRLFQYCFTNYNGEQDIIFMPSLPATIYDNRALPQILELDWETSDTERFRGNIFLNEKVIFEKFKNFKTEDKQEFEIKISKDNRVLELYLNQEPIEVDSVRIYKGSVMYEGSY